MDESRIEFFLDDGWSLVGRTQQWLSRGVHADDDQAELIELIRRLQTFWAAAHDLELPHLSRCSLLLEQVLERFCAGTLKKTPDCLLELASGLSCLQELLLGFEATREELIASNDCTLERLERLVLQPIPVSVVQTAEELIENVCIAEQSIPQNTSTETLFTPDINATIASAEAAAPFSDIETTSDSIASTPAHRQYDDSILKMLEQFVVQIDDTCHFLHARMVADEAPYVVTTSRLEHLAQATRTLVAKLAQQTRATIAVDESLDLITNLSQESEIAPLVSLKEETSLVNDHFDRPEPVLDLPALSVPPEVPNNDLHLLSSTSEPGQAESNSLMTGLQVVANHSPRRVLVVEESLFFRNLISLAVQSAGFDAQSVDSGTSGLALVKSSPWFDAILIGPSLSIEMAEAIEQSRQTFGTKVIGLVPTNSGPSETTDVDDRVPRSNPQQLINVLNQTFNHTSPAGVLCA